MTEYLTLASQEQAPVVVADQDGRIRAVNRAFEQTYGWSMADLEGRLLTAIIPQALREAHHLGFSRYLLTNEARILNQELPLEIIAKDGTATMATHHIVAMKGAEGLVFLARIVPRNAT